MKQMLDSGHAVEFGQSLEETERLLGPGMELLRTVRPYRDGVDKRFKVGEVTLDFDNQRLRGIKFEYPYQFLNAPAPYAEAWKNLNPLGTSRIHGGMSRDDFSAYLDVWEACALDFGMSRIPFSVLSPKQFAITWDRDRFSDMVSISFGPTRRAGGGGLWADGYTAFFAMNSNSRPMPPEGTLSSLSATKDDYDSVARPKPLLP